MLKTCVNDCPLGSVPELNSLPESEVTVWPTESWFVHVTVSPTLIFKVGGKKAKFAMVTLCVVGVGPELGVGFGVGAGDGIGLGFCTGVEFILPENKKYPPTSTATIIIPIITHIAVFIFIQALPTI
jgi:hypothetical protein